MNQVKQENLELECPHCGKEFRYRHEYGSKPWDPVEEEIAVLEEIAEENEEVGE